MFGSMLAVGATYALRGLLYGLRVVDGVSFVGVSLLFMAVALVAADVPARRASRRPTWPSDTSKKRGGVYTPKRLRAAGENEGKAS